MGVLGGVGAHRSGQNRPATEAATVGIEREKYERKRGEREIESSACARSGIL